MNNTYTTSSLPQQQQHQNQSAQQQQQSAQSIAYLPAHAHLQQHLNTITDEHLTNSGGAYFGARALEKTYANYAGPTGRYFTTASTTPATGLPGLTAPHNTILITNNFAQQNLPQNDAVTTVLPQTHATLNAAAHNYNNANNIHILSTAPNNSNNNNNNLFNLNKDGTIEPATLRLPHGHFFQQNQQFATHLTNLQHAHPYHQHFATLAAQQQQQQHSINHGTMHFGNIPATVNATPTAPHYFAHATAEQLTNVDNNKLMPGLVDATTTKTPTTSASNNSTVVLDRINICINNHYNEAIATNNNNNIETPLSCSTITTADNAGQQQEQQPSPVIPAIQHKAALLPDNVTTLLNSATIDNNAIHIIDEPDSTTTTAHTPPITPNNATAEQIMLNSPIHQSPSTTTAITTDVITFATNGMEGNDMEVKTQIIKKCNIKNYHNIIEVSKEAMPTTTIVIDCDENDEDVEQENTVEEIQQNDDSYEKESIQKPTSPATHVTDFKIGEDVLLKRQDNCFYLGTVVGNAHQQYLVRFDDQSEQWCVAEEMRKLGGGGCKSDKKANNAGSSILNGDEYDLEAETPMCVACKLLRPNDIVECCERCGRGYHRGCTSEVFPGSNEWLCKRCAKPMKVNKNNEHEEQMSPNLSICRQLPYHVDSLSWDEKHRVNEEQIYCYCGKTGKFDYNMLQCCKCKNWFHTHCIQNFKTKLLRGDW